MAMQVLTKAGFIQALTSTLKDYQSHTVWELKNEFSQKRKQSTPTGFLEFLKLEEVDLLKRPEISPSPALPNLTPESTAELVALLLDKESEEQGSIPINWNDAFLTVLRHSPPNYTISRFYKEFYARNRLYLVKKLLEEIEANKQKQNNRKETELTLEMTDSYDPTVFRVDLQNLVNIAVRVKVDDYTNEILSVCEVLSTVGEKQTFLDDERKLIMAAPELRWKNRVNEHLPLQIEAILENPLPYWKLRASTTVEGFLAKVPALQDAVNVMFVAEKIRVLEEIHAQIVALPDEKTKVLKEDIPSGQTLPSIEEAVKNPAILSKIWEKCASFKRLVFDKDGNFIWEGKREHAVLYAFSTAMKQRNFLSANVGTKDFYLILCQKHGVEPASRIDRIPRGNTTFQDFFVDFLEILEELTNN